MAACLRRTAIPLAKMRSMEGPAPVPSISKSYTGRQDVNRRPSAGALVGCAHELGLFPRREHPSQNCTGWPAVHTWGRRWSAPREQFYSRISRGARTVSARMCFGLAILPFARAAAAFFADGRSRTPRFRRPQHLRRGVAVGWTRCALITPHPNGSPKPPGRTNSDGTTRHLRARPRTGAGSRPKASGSAVRASSAHRGANRSIFAFAFAGVAVPAHAQPR